jgi:hypothetical protein
MWPFRKKPATTQKTFHGFDLTVWDYLGSTEIKFNKVPIPIYFFWKKETHERAYTVTGHSKFFLNEVTKIHPFVINECELWRIGESVVYTSIHRPSIFFKEWIFSEYNYVWSTEKSWWVCATDADKYKRSVAQTQKETPKIVTDNNVLTVDFKNRNS